MYILISKKLHGLFKLNVNLKKKRQLVYILKSLKMVKEKIYFKDGSFLDQGKLSVKINR